MTNFLPMANGFKNKTRIKTGRLVFFVLVFLIFLAPRPLLAAGARQVILSYDFINSTAYKNSPVQWQIFYNQDENLYDGENGLKIKSDGDFYLVYPVSFSYRDFDRINLVLSSDQPLEITVVPDVTTTGYTNFELVKKIPAGSELQKTNISLRIKFFKETVDNIGLRFVSAKPADITLTEVSLEKMSPVEVLAQGFKDYFRVAPYNSFTVNLFPTPRIWGRSALVYFLPLILLFIWLLFFSKKWQKTAAIVLVVAWALIDSRMTYEFFFQHLADYQTFVKPPTAEKSLRNYGDFYQFADWLKINFGSEIKEINYYGGQSAHFPRLLQYLIYPIKIDNEGKSAKVFVFYQGQNIAFDPAGKRVYQNGQPLTGEGEIINIYVYDKDSFIFQEK